MLGQVEEIFYLCPWAKRLNNFVVKDRLLFQTLLFSNVDITGYKDIVLIDGKQ